MKFTKDYTKEIFSFQWTAQLYHQKIHWDLGRTCYRVTVSEAIKAIVKKIKQTKAQYSLDSLAAKAKALSSGTVCKYEFLTGEEVLLEKNLLEKAGTIKGFEYLLLGIELKKQT